MEPIKPEPNSERLETKETIIPRETARALGRGLNQVLSQPLELIKSYIDKLKNNPQVNQDCVQATEKAISRILAIPDNLEHAKEAKIVPLPGGLLDFSFSEERATEGQPPTQSEIIIDATTTPKLSLLTNVMQHNFNDSFGSLFGYPELIEELTNDPTVKQQAAEIVSISRSMYRHLNFIQTEDHQLKISTDATGSTTITPIQYYTRIQRSLAGQKT